MLSSAGIKEIEAGIPAAGITEKKFVEQLISIDNMRVMTWNRAKIEDINDSLSCGAQAVDISFPVSDIMIENKLKKSRDWLIGELGKCLEFAKSKGLYVSIGCEDATRANKKFLLEFVREASSMGADRVRIADTVGIAEPFGFHSLIKNLKDNTDIDMEVHTHNDFGLAVANAIAGILGGAKYISATLLGIGERAGNAAICQVATILEIMYKMDTGIDLKKLNSACSKFSEIANVSIPENKPIIGKNAFTHKSGIHIDGTLKNKGCYVPFLPEIIGRKIKFVAGNLTGKNALKKLIFKTGIQTDEYLTEEVFRIVLNSKKSFSLTDISKIVKSVKTGKCSVF